MPRSLLAGAVVGGDRYDPGYLSEQISITKYNPMIEDALYL